MPLRPSAHDWTGLALLLRAHEVVLAAQETRLDSAGDVGLLETWKWAKTGRKEGMAAPPPQAPGARPSAETPFIFRNRLHPRVLQITSFMSQDKFIDAETSRFVVRWVC